MVPALLAGAALLAAMLNPLYQLCLLGYFLLTTTYSLWLKNQVVVDVLLLAALYTSRVIAGAAATLVQPSFWLLAFSMFMFLSLAVVKRYSEMLVLLKRNVERAPGRGYSVNDLPVLMGLGTASGYCAVLVLALYVNSVDVGALYSHSRVLWLALPLVLYWISRMWMKTHRGEMHDDPVVFAARDWQSLVIAGLIAAILTVAT
jgi:4-hydroxybenzoate polyprenyltransferase